LYVSASGNVGIGTTIPGSLLQVGGLGATPISTPTAIQMDNSFRNAVGGNTSLKFYLYKNSTEAYGFGLNNAGGIEYHAGLSGGGAAHHAFYTDTTEKVRITAAGNVGIGTTSPSGSLTIQTNGTGLRLQTSSGPGAYYSTISSLYDSTHPFSIGVANNSSNTSEFIGVYADSGGSNNRVVFPTGSVGIGTISPTLSSGTGLHINSVSGHANLKLQSSGRTWEILSTTGTYFSIFDTTGGTDRLSINSSGNVGIGTTSPGNKLEVKGADDAAITAIFQSTAGGNAAYNGGIQLGNGASSQNSQIYHNSSGDNTLTFVSNYGSGTGNKFIFAPGGTERVRFQQNGNVGIGTTSPGAKLQVVGTANVIELVQATSGSATYYVMDNTVETGGRRYRFGYSGASADKGSFTIYNATDNITPLTILTSGSVGIGTTAPTSRLHVTGSTGGVFEVDTAGGATTLYVSASGNVGIGTTNPIFKFQVVGSAYVNTGTLYIDSGNSLTWGNSTQSILGTNDVGLSFVAGSATRMFISSSGNVGIGTTSPGSKLQVSGTNVNDGSSYYTMNILNTALAVSGVGSGLMFGTNIGTASNIYIQGMAGIEGIKENGTNNDYASALKFTTRINGGSLTERMRITSDGNVGIGTTSPATKLEVYGVVRVSESSSGGILQLTAGASAIDIASTFYGGSRRPITFTMDAEKVRIATDGNVGIGSSSPVAKLDVAGNSKLGSSISNAHQITGSLSITGSVSGINTESFHPFLLG